MKKLFFAAFGLMIIQACSDVSTEQADTVSLPTQQGIEETAQPFKIYSLPAPMQIAESLKNVEGAFLGDRLVPAQQGTTTRLNKALLTGMLGVDIGYSLSYDHPQEALTYLEKVLRIADELKIMADVKPEVINRFRDNISNQDSTTFILLGSFNLFQNYLKKTQDEVTGLYIFTGSFIEGLHLALAHQKENPGQELVNLIGQQKVFLENIIELMASNNANGDLLARFRELKELYNPIRLTYTSTGDDRQTFDDIKIEGNQLDAINVKVQEIRTYILQNT